MRAGLLPTLAMSVLFVLDACTADPEGSADRTPATTTTTTDTSIPPPAAAWWRPSVGVTWQWQLTGEVDVSVDADVFDVDLFTTSDDVVAALGALGRRTICYLSAGTFEPWRPDADRFPPDVIGEPLDDWPDERWLDIRRLDALGPILEERLDLCRAKGFDGVEPDNVDGYANDSGFPLTDADQLAFNRWLADRAHERGLAVALKNDLDQVAELEPWFDLAVNEECFEFDECATLAPFVETGKPVLHVEYAVDASEFCPATTALGLSSMRKRLDLDAWFERCP